LKTWFRQPDSAATAGHGIRASRIGRGPRTRKVCENMHNVDMLLDWLDASMDIRNSRNIWGTATKFARVFGMPNSISTVAVLGQLRPANMQVLRDARPRLDAVACLIFRQFWKTLVPSSIDIYIYLDSSPQIRGEELFAASFELRDIQGHFPWERRLFPLVSLHGDFMDAIGKAVGLLWMIFLLVGPCHDDVINCCNRVRCIVSDMGTERKIATLADLVPEFYSVMLGRSELHIAVCSRLFPVCIASPGWMHGWDIILQRGLRSLTWFHVFIVG